jgi:hypothetical protein
MSELGTYHGASTMMRKTLDWNRSRISMLEVEAVPQNCIPWVQMGLNMIKEMLIGKSLYFRTKFVHSRLI